MSREPGSVRRLIWATRGRSWGFRFLLDGELADPLPEYERAFSGLAEDLRIWQRAGATVAVRFPDPSGRRDAAGRVIPHEFVLRGEIASQVDSVDDALRLIWPLVEDAYRRVWDVKGPPSAADLRLIT